MAHKAVAMEELTKLQQSRDTIAVEVGTLRRRVQSVEQYARRDQTCAYHARHPNTAPGATNSVQTLFTTL